MNYEKLFSAADLARELGRGRGRRRRRMKLICMRGYPASGKSTLARAVASEPGVARVSRDDLRASLFVGVQGVGTQDQENTVTRVIEAQATALLRAGTSVVVDNTNLRLKDLKRWAEIAHKHGAGFEVFDVPTDVETCVARDKARGEAGGREVGETVIRNFAQRFPVKNWPKVEATTPAQPKQYVPDPNLPKAVTIDVDGTVANLVGVRGPYDTSKYNLDTSHSEIIELVRIYKYCGFGIVFLSGRSEDFYDVTMNWLGSHLGFIPDHLVMRKSGDMRNDAIIKPELFWEHVAPYWDVHLHVDDRQRVVDAMRDIGLPVLQCRPGDF